VGDGTRSTAVQGWIDIHEVKRAAPIAEVVGRYGIELRPSGRARIGRCPFHDDQGRPNLHVYGDTESFYCYRCRVGGDVITFVERMERVGFREAVARLVTPAWLARPSSRPPRPVRRVPPPGVRVTVAEPCQLHGPDEQACLAAAVDLYHHRLLADVEAMRYVRARGLDEATIERHRIGFAAGDELVDLLRWRRLPIGAARKLGLLVRHDREFFARRVVVPEFRDGAPIWLVGRAIDSPSGAPKYLGLPGRKPLLGWDAVRDEPVVCLSEGVFDWLTLSAWGVPALCLVGTHARPDTLAALSRFEQVYLVLDHDAAGAAATDALIRALGERARPVELPELPRVKDIADLAVRPDGRALFACAVQRAALVGAQPIAAA
ncbi:MAG: CHC2 zinc finger domain-containing protein, partial [Chloroflexota bacterium]